MIENLCYKCKWYHKMRDINIYEHEYKIDFCGFEMEAIPVRIGGCHYFEEKQ